MERPQWVEVSGDLDDLVCEIMLEHEPGSLVRVAEGEDPTCPDRLYLVLVPPWGQA